MATGLVKWWRARFLAGYKPFSVVGGTAEGSDSEELLACVAPPCSSSPLPPRVIVTPETSTIGGAPSARTATCSSTPTAHTANDDRSNPSNAANPTRQLSFEEFECDVSVAEGDRRRQEFSFTLYDFDGHGKITKDDIAGLVTTIYDTLGASIQVPPCGSKTIKVKLTVSPDQRATSLVTGQTQTYVATTSEIATASTTTATTTSTTAVSAIATTTTVATVPTATTTTVATSSTPTIANASLKTTNDHLPGGNIAPASSYCCHVKHVASCGHANHQSRRGPRRRRALRSRGEPERVADSHSDEDADNVPAVLTVTAATTTTTTTTTTTGVSSPSKQEELRRRVGPAANPPASPYSNSSEGDVSDESDASPAINPLTPLVTNQRKRSGSMQRQQLLEIIQANMEKNNLSFHASRKRHQSEQLRIPLRNPYDIVEPTSPYIEKCGPTSTTRHPTVYHKPVREQHQQNQQQQHHHHHHHPHNNPSSLTKLSGKTRTVGNTRKQRNQQSIQRNSMTTPPPPLQSLRNNLQRQSPTNENVNLLNTSTIRNNQQQQQNDQQNNQQYVTNQTTNTNNLNNHQRNDGNYGQSQNNGKTGKKHQLKHATREQDQARAMAQVVRWLEREFSQNSAVASTAGRRHVHKHIHHHYHHYHAEALV